MAENTDKQALQAAKEAEKAAKKAKQERIKPKKEGSAFSRAGKAVKKFFKDFTGTCKKIVWPTGKQVVKNSLVVLATIIVIGAIVALIDFGLTKIFDLGEQGVVALAEYVGGDEETTAAAEDTSLEDALAGLETEAAEAEAEEETEAEAEEKTEAETEAPAEETVEETTQAAEEETAA